MEKIVFVTTASFTVKVYLYPHIRAMSEHFDITIVSDGDAEYFQDILSSNISFVPITINRKINIISDIKALFFLYRLFRKEKFVSAHSIMPKSGLLGMSIAFLTKTKIRIHTFTGQPWVTMKPPLRWILMGMDKLVGYFSTAVLADSQSQLQFLLDRNIIDQNKSKVLGAGSICGVNMKRFQQNAASRAKLRAKLKFNVDDVVFLYLGRLTKEKGLIDLAFAFKEVRHSCSSVKLVYVGPEEDAIVEETRTILGDDLTSFSYFPYTSEPELYYNIADVYCLPSMREGFGSAIIEAAAFGIPSIGSNIYGISDAIIDGQTGILFEQTSREQLTSAMNQMATDHELRKKLGQQALSRTSREFSEDAVTHNLLTFYKDAFKKI